MTTFNGLTLNTVTYISTGFGEYTDNTVTLGAPTRRFKINPGRVVKPKDTTQPSYRQCGWTFNREFDKTVNGETVREPLLVTLSVRAGLDITDAEINAIIDDIAALPDSGRLTQILLGAS